MSAQPESLRLACEYADAVAVHRLESLYGASKTYTLVKATERDKAYEALAAELHRLHSENVQSAVVFVEHQRELSKALDQRDELLVALVKLEAAFTDADITSREYRRNARLALIAARAAIAKVEGGAA